MNLAIKKAVPMLSEVIVELLQRPVKSGSDIAAAVKDLFQTLSEEALHRIPSANRSGVCVFDQQDGTLSFAAVAGHGWIPEIASVTLMIEQKSAAARAIRTKQAFLIEDTTYAEDYRELFPSDCSRSHVSVPIFWRKQAAVLSLESREVSAFADETLIVLQSLAAQSLIALEHFALIEDQWLLHLNDILASPSGLKSICEQTLDHIRRVFGALGGSIFLQYPFTSELRLAATTAPDLSFTTVPKYGLGAGLTGWVAEKNKNLRLRDIMDSDELTTKAPDLKWAGMWSEVDYPGQKSFLAAPMHAQDSSIGVVRLVGKEGGASFTSHDEILLNSIASRLALAIQNLWYREEAERREHLDRLGRELADARDVQKIAKTIIDEALKIFGGGSGHIRLLDKGGENLRLVYSYPETKLFNLPKLRRIGDGLAGKVAITKQPIVIPDATNDEPFLAAAASVLQVQREEIRRWIRSEACFPLIAQRQFLGTINLHSNRIAAFGPNEERLLWDLANRSAIALSVAQAFEEQRELLRILKEIGVEFVTEPNMDKFLTGVLEAALKLSGSAWGVVRKLTEHRDTWELLAAADDKNSQIRKELSIYLPVVADDLLHRATNNRGPTKIIDADQDTVFQKFLNSVTNPSQLAFLRTVRSVLLVPMWFANRAIGYIFLGFKVPYDVPDSTVQFLEILAAEAALAIENAKLNQPLAVMGSLLGGFLHAARSPLHRLLAILSNMASNDPNRENLRTEVQVFKRLLEEIFLFTSSGVNSSFETIDINDIIGRVAHDKLISVEDRIEYKLLTSPETLLLRANRLQIEQAFGLIVDNAIEAMLKSGTLSIRVSGTAEVIGVEFEDTGIGMDEETRSRSLQPFFSTKRGSGLGLSIVHNVMARHGGTIEIFSKQGQGTTVRLVFPRKECDYAADADRG